MKSNNVAKYKLIILRFTILNILIYYFMCICVSRESTCHSMHVEVTCQLSETGCLLPHLHGFQRSDLGSQAFILGQQAPLHTEASCTPSFLSF